MDWTLQKLVNHWSVESEKIVVISCLTLINQYDAYIIEVADLTEILVFLYWTNLETKKWYYHIIYYWIGVL